MARRTTTTAPATKQPAQLSHEQMQRGIILLKRRLTELQEFKPEDVTDQFQHPEMDQLENHIVATLTKVFGADTLDFERYSCSFSTGPIRFGARLSPIEVQKHVRSSQERMIAGLQGAISWLEEELADSEISRPKPHVPSPQGKSLEPLKTVEGHCPECGASRNARVRGEHHNNSSGEVDGGQYTVSFSDGYRILECGGCSTLYCQRVQYCSEWGDAFDQDSFYKITFWPSTAQCQPPKWLSDTGDPKLEEILVEVYAATNNAMPILAAVGIRTAFDRATELLNIKTALPFEKKLDALKLGGLLSTSDREGLAALVNAGSAAAHRGWKPSDDRLLTMIRILEAFLHREFVMKDALADLTSSVPLRPSK